MKAYKWGLLMVVLAVIPMKGFAFMDIEDLDKDMYVNTNSVYEHKWAFFPTPKGVWLTPEGPGEAQHYIDPKKIVFDENGWFKELAPGVDESNFLHNSSSWIPKPDEVILRHIDEEGKQYGVTMSAYTGDITSTGFIKAKGISAGGEKVKDVADGEISESSKEAINGSQLYKALQGLGGTANHHAIGAHGAALAALHPLPYTPDSKFHVAVGYGNYKSASAMAVGVFYTPNRSLMVSTGIVMGADSDQVYNVGLSYRFGKQANSDVSVSPTSKDDKVMRLEYEVKRLQEENKQQAEIIHRLESQQNKILEYIKK